MSRLGLSAMLAMTAWSAPLAAADYKVLVSGVASGSMTVSDQGNERQIAYSFIDRGRGPELQSSVATDAQGYLTRLSIRGVGYYKLPDDEKRRQMELNVLRSNSGFVVFVRPSANMLWMYSLTGGARLYGRCG